MISAVPYRFKYRHNAPLTLFVFKVFSAVPNCFKCCHNAPFTVLVFIFSWMTPSSSCFPLVLCFIFLITVSNIVQKCQRAIFSDLVFEIVYAVRNCSNKYDKVKTLFSKLSLKIQIVLECML